ncbi:hypothetical protein J2W25_002616 [Variovorax boronicumulans]|uniref:G domain-containing protein n=1 Tax=Variovorax boronicumulans TaxID=436515 RepID=A0AAW8DVM9_9BURK|nr:GTPase/DUF3482 domain-containing protein [Variovorax boronicumulans]MDP9878403.1 hypothetical protein [Variovorax boronicumulans]MDP9916098.1 hypothetical protein [Variovorax boronicumulans]MDP9923593.1 hypothetical protein [Variovorax boronicumulans]PBI94002.1 GTP-binding protein YsxC [Variovorax boronicumulans]
MTAPTPIRIAVVGHTNAGKTSLLRTLTRRVNFGEVSQRPGTTRHVESVDLEVNGQPAVRFLDTPGLEDAVALREHLAGLDAAQQATPPERIRRFLQGPEAQGVFEQEAKVLRAMLDIDAAFLVIDVREPVLPKFRDEIELLNSCARPVLPVLNFVRDAASREPAWKELLSAYGLHVQVRFDAAAPFVGAEHDLYNDLATLLRDRRDALRGVVDALDAEADARRQSACTRIADLLVDAASIRRTVPAAEFADATRRQALVAGVQKDVFDKAQRCTDDLLALYGFRQGDADEAPLPIIEGRWTLDFFNPEAMKDAGLRLGKGAVIGAAVGVVADLAVAGLSLGAGAALGGAIGGAVSQGWGPLGRKLANKLRDMHELTVEDSVLFTLAAWQLQLAQALERRGHAAVERIRAEAPSADEDDTLMRAAAGAVRAVQPARSHPEWESTGALTRSFWRPAPQREALAGTLSSELRRAFEA